MGGVVQKTGLWDRDRIRSTRWISEVTDEIAAITTSIGGGKKRISVNTQKICEWKHSIMSLQKHQITKNALSLSLGLLANWLDCDERFHFFRTWPFATIFSVFLSLSIPS